MPSILNSITQGLKTYKDGVKYQTHNNTVAQSAWMAKQRNISPVKPVAKAIGIGAASFLAPPVVIGAMAVRAYRETQSAEAQKARLSEMTGTLKSHGISPGGASEMAHQIIMNNSTDERISDADFKMWMVVASVIEPSLAKYTSRISNRLESQKPKINLA